MQQTRNANSMQEFLTKDDVYVEDSLKDRASVLEFCSKKMHINIAKKMSYRLFIGKVKETDETNIILPSGLYMPHLKLAEIDRIMAILVLTKQGVFDTLSGNKFYVTFFFLSPLNPAFFQKHLNLLSYISSTFNEENIKAMRNIQTSSELYSFIKSLNK